MKEMDNFLSKMAGVVGILMGFIIGVLSQNSPLITRTVPSLCEILSFYFKTLLYSACFGIMLGLLTKIVLSIIEKLKGEE